ncbi:MAG: radical SAM protein [Candidatus Omnitrophota bacterium]
MNVAIKSFARYRKYFKLLKRAIFKKPVLLLRIAYSYFRIFVLRKKIVRKVEIGVTFKCQCSCSKCSSAFMDVPGRKELNVKELRDVAKDILSLGAVHINLTGGEPLIAEDIFEIIKALQPQKVLITINTNGLLLTEDMIDRLDKAGVDIIKISLDSPLEEEHDQSRGYKGCFKQIAKALAYIKKKKRMIGQISTVCIKENLISDKIWKLIEMAKQYDVLLGLTIPAVSGKWIDDEGILLGKKEREILVELIKIPHVIRDVDEAYMRSHCPAGSEEFYLTRYGDVIPCPLIQISFGNVKEESLKSIWRKMTDFKGFKDKEKPGCLAGENREFIEKYLLPLKNYKPLPLSINKHPLMGESFDVAEKDS